MSHVKENQRLKFQIVVVVVSPVGKRGAASVSSENMENPKGKSLTSDPHTSSLVYGAGRTHSHIHIVDPLKLVQ